MVLLRKSIPQNHNLKTAAELGVILGAGKLRYLIVFLFVSLTSCVSEKSKLISNVVTGVWGVDLHQVGLPDSCKSIEFSVYKNGNLKMESGLQVISAQYTLENIIPGEYILKQSNISSNGKANCQNISSEYVLSHFVEAVYLEIDGDNMLMHFGPSKNAPAFKLNRKK